MTTVSKIWERAIELYFNKLKTSDVKRYLYLKWGQLLKCEKLEQGQAIYPFTKDKFIFEGCIWLFIVTTAGFSFDSKSGVPDSDFCCGTPTFQEKLSKLHSGTPV